MGTIFSSNPNETADACRFLAQSTLGASMDEINHLVGQDYGQWIDEQQTKPISYTRPYMEEIWEQRSRGGNVNYDASREQFPFYLIPGPNPYFQSLSGNFTTPWMRNMVHGEDVLRQRVAWSLSQILVVSMFGGLQRFGVTIADYYDLLATHALGNYRDLLVAMSMHPGVSKYLSSLGNQKADPSINRYPDENYARELMQLFTIGLWELNQDGTKRFDSDGLPIPTYDNQDVSEMARVFTGLWFEGVDWGEGVLDARNMAESLVFFDEEHDREEKKLLHGKDWETILPAEQSGEVDLEQVVDLLFNHPNVPPFICKQLIQFLVKSHPSNGYIERVADTFVNNGNDIRGDLHAVVRTILLDPEAREYNPNDIRGGKLVEPMVRITRLFKAFKAGHNEPNLVYWWWPEVSGTKVVSLGQWPMFSSSVFNFFRPEYIDFQSPLGEASPPVNSPELMVTDFITIPELANYLYACIFDGIHSVYRDDSSHLPISEYDYSEHLNEFNADGQPNPAYIPPFEMDFSDEVELADDIEALIDHLDLLLCCGQMTTQTRQLLRRGLELVEPPLDEDKRLLRVKTAVYILAVSADTAVLK